MKAKSMGRSSLSILMKKRNFEEDYWPASSIWLFELGFHFWLKRCTDYAPSSNHPVIHVLDLPCSPICAMLHPCQTDADWADWVPLQARRRTSPAVMFASWCKPQDITTGWGKPVALRWILFVDCEVHSVLLCGTLRGIGGFRKKTCPQTPNPPPKSYRPSLTDSCWWLKQSLSVTVLECPCVCSCVSSRQKNKKIFGLFQFSNILYQYLWPYVPRCPPFPNGKIVTEHTKKCHIKYKY